MNEALASQYINHLTAPMERGKRLGRWERRRMGGGQVMRRKRGVQEEARGGEGREERGAKWWSAIAPLARRSRRSEGRRRARGEREERGAKRWSSNAPQARRSRRSKGEKRATKAKTKVPTTRCGRHLIYKVEGSRSPFPVPRFSRVSA